MKANSLYSSPLRACTHTGVSLILLSAVATAQTSFPEVEPNSVRSEATAASCLVAGDFLTGATTGTGATAGDGALTTVDMWRVRTCALPLGIYRHRLVISSATVGHTGTIRGLTVTNTTPPPMITATDTALQTSSTTSTPPRFNQWYGFGRQEELYYRVSGTTTTVSPYTSTLETVAVVANPIPGVFNAGTITITTVGQGHTTDTEIHVFDANLVALPGFMNDDDPGGTTLQSRLVRYYAPGTYYVVIGRFNVADNQLTGFDDDFQTGAVNDFPDSLLDTSTTSGGVINFAVTDSAGTVPVAAALAASPYEVSWFVLTVVGTPTAAAGGDILETPAGAASFDFAATPLPAGFFGPGSDPFTGLVSLGGAQLTGSNIPSGASTIVRRTGDALLGPCPAPDSIPIEIVALNLVSVNPISVTFNGGSTTSTYDLRVSVSSSAVQPLGNAQLFRSSQSGGTYSSTLPVIPRLVFTKLAGVSGSPNVTTDPGPPVQLQQPNFMFPQPGNWSYNDGGLGALTSIGGLVDHDSNPATALRPYPPTSNFFVGIARPGADCFNPGGGPVRIIEHPKDPIVDHGVEPPVVGPPSTEKCGNGDVTRIPCPCINGTDPHAGCANSLNPAGAALSTTGVVAADNVVLNATGMTGSIAIFFRTDGRTPGGVPFGDGVTCTGGQLLRLRAVAFPSGISSVASFPVPPETITLSARSGTFPGSGVRYQYAAFYRNAAASFCPPSTFNVTDTEEILW